MCRRTVAAIMTIPLLVTAACERQPDTTPAFQHEIRDSAGGRNGIRGHVLIVDHGVP